MLCIILNKNLYFRIIFLITKLLFYFFYLKDRPTKMAKTEKDEQDTTNTIKETDTIKANLKTAIPVAETNKSDDKLEDTHVNGTQNSDVANMETDIIITDKIESEDEIKKTEDNKPNEKTIESAATDEAMDVDQTDIISTEDKNKIDIKTNKTAIVETIVSAETVESTNGVLKENDIDLIDETVTPNKNSDEKILDEKEIISGDVVDKKSVCDNGIISEQNTKTDIPSTDKNEEEQPKNKCDDTNKTDNTKVSTVETNNTSEDSGNEKNNATEPNETKADSSVIEKVATESAIIKNDSTLATTKDINKENSSIQNNTESKEQNPSENGKTIETDSDTVSVIKNKTEENEAKTEDIILPKVIQNANSDNKTIESTNGNVEMDVDIGEALKPNSTTTAVCPTLTQNIEVAKTVEAEPTKNTDSVIKDSEETTNNETADLMKKDSKVLKNGTKALNMDITEDTLEIKPAEKVVATEPMSTEEVPEKSDSIKSINADKIHDDKNHEDKLEVSMKPPENNGDAINSETKCSKVVPIIETQIKTDDCKSEIKVTGSNGTEKKFENGNNMDVDSIEVPIIIQKETETEESKTNPPLDVQTTQKTEISETIETSSDLSKEKKSRVEITIEQIDKQSGQTTQTTTHIVKEISITEQKVTGKKESNAIDKENIDTVLVSTKVQLDNKSVVETDEQTDNNLKVTVANSADNVKRSISPIPSSAQNGKSNSELLSDAVPESNGTQKCENDSDKENDESTNGEQKQEPLSIINDGIIKKCSDAIKTTVAPAEIPTEPEA